MQNSSALSHTALITGVILVDAVVRTVTLGADGPTGGLCYDGEPVAMAAP